MNAENNNVFGGPPTDPAKNLGTNGVFGPDGQEMFIIGDDDGLNFRIYDEQTDGNFVARNTDNQTHTPLSSN